MTDATKRPKPWRVLAGVGPVPAMIVNANGNEVCTIKGLDNLAVDEIVKAVNQRDALVAFVEAMQEPGRLEKHVIADTARALLDKIKSA